MIIKQRIQKSDGTIRFRNYLKQEKLGKGGFAQCFTVERIQDHRQFALKIIKKSLLKNNKARQKMLSEIRIHRSCKHKNICELQRAFEDQDNVYVLLELCNKRNMFELMQRRKKLTTQETQYYILQLIDGLCYLHNRKIIHRDIKLGNILINDKMQLKIADFGLATDLEFIGDRKHTVCGTPNYIAPQIIRASLNQGPSGYSFEVDIWSLGVLMFVMLTGKAPFQTDKLDKTYMQILKCQFQFPNSFRDQAAKDLIRKILVADPSKRYTFEQILQHPFMNPKNGVPKQIPPSSMFSAPKFGSKGYIKFECEDIKQSARNASINTLRSSIDETLEEQCDQAESEISKKSPRSSSSKDVKGLLKSVFSSSSISKSIEKIQNLGSSLANNLQSKSFKNEEDISNTARLKNLVVSSNLSGTRLSSSALINSNLVKTPKTSMNFSEINPEKSQPVFILDYKKQVIWSYILSSGYIGTYQSQQDNYKILYNPGEKTYFQIHNDGTPKRVKQQNVLMNQNVHNRLKFINNFEQATQCPNYKSQSFTILKNLVYLKRVFEVKAQSVILFKFSNNDIQTFNYQTNFSLLVTNTDLIMVQIVKGKQVSRLVHPKDKYVECKNKNLISMYLKAKRILIKISNLGKQ